MERYQRPDLAGVSEGMLARMEQQQMGGNNRDGVRKGRGKVGMAFDPIAAALRQMHENVTAEDIPDDFLRLLDEIDQKSSQKNAE